MKIGIHQPNYIPWSGYFYKIIQSDAFIILDDVQFEKNSFADRNSIKTPQGSCYLKIPVETKGLNTNYNEVRIKDELNWREKHLKTIEMNYKRSPYFSEVFADLINLYSCNETMLSNFNASLIRAIAQKLEIKTTMHFSHEVKTIGSSTERLIELVKNFGGTQYFSGKGGEKYQDTNMFADNGIELIYTNFNPPNYKQLWGEFLPNLSILDLLFCCGYEQSSMILRKSGEKAI